jgi:hypothetical protein
VFKIPLDKDLAEEIKKGGSLQKVDEADVAAREAEKKKRAEELEKVKQALEGQG